MKRWIFLLALFPLLIGGLIDLYLELLSRINPIAFLRIDLGSLALMIGFIASLIAGISCGILLLWEDRRLRIISASADERHRFLRRLDHELKNPLTAIRAALANLTESPSEKARQEALASIEAQTLRLSRLSSDLRKLAELESRLVEHAPVDVPALLQEVFSLAQDQPGAGERHLSLNIPQAPWPLPKVTGDPDLLLLAVHNLMENALKFSRPGDTIELHASEDGTNLVIQVADTGPGIPGDEQPHVWEELYRGQAGRGVPGSGLGLALVRAIAERHNGQVSLRSRPGQGTIFTLRLPVG